MAALADRPRGDHQYRPRHADRRSAARDAPRGDGDSQGDWHNNSHADASAYPVAPRPPGAAAPREHAFMGKMDEPGRAFPLLRAARSEEHTSELQSLMRNSYSVFC